MLESEPRVGSHDYLYNQDVELTASEQLEWNGEECLNGLEIDSFQGQAQESISDKTLLA